MFSSVTVVRNLFFNVWSKFGRVFWAHELVVCFSITTNVCTIYQCKCYFLSSHVSNYKRLFLRQNLGLESVIVMSTEKSLRYITSGEKRLVCSRLWMTVVYKVWTISRVLLCSSFFHWTVGSTVWFPHIYTEFPSLMSVLHFQHTVSSLICLTHISTELSALLSVLHFQRTVSSAICLTHISSELSTLLSVLHFQRTVSSASCLTRISTELSTLLSVLHFQRTVSSALCLTHISTELSILLSVLHFQRTVSSALCLTFPTNCQLWSLSYSLFHWTAVCGRWCVPHPA